MTCYDACSDSACAAACDTAHPDRLRGAERGLQLRADELRDDLRVLIVTTIPSTPAERRRRRPLALTKHGREALFTGSAKTSRPKSIRRCRTATCASYPHRHSTCSTSKRGEHDDDAHNRSGTRRMDAVPQLRG